MKDKSNFMGVINMDYCYGEIETRDNFLKKQLIGIEKEELEFLSESDCSDEEYELAYKEVMKNIKEIKNLSLEDLEKRYVDKLNQEVIK
jgi:hypothetical protein